MKRRSFLKGVAGAGAAAALTGVNAKVGQNFEAAAQTAVPIPGNKPNILIIIGDDFRQVPRWVSQSVRSKIDRMLKNLTELRTQSISFQNHYTAALFCRPARACLYTGLYTPQHNVVGTGWGFPIPAPLDDNAYNPAQLPYNPDVTKFPPYAPSNSTVSSRYTGANMYTWGSFLRQAPYGYSVDWFGKWHLTHQEVYDAYYLPKNLNNSDNSGVPIRPQDGPLGVRYNSYGVTLHSFTEVNGGPHTKPGMEADKTIAASFETWFGTEINKTTGRKKGTGGGPETPWCATVSFVNPHDGTYFRDVQNISSFDTNFAEYLKLDINDQDTNELALDPNQVFQSVPPNFEFLDDPAKNFFQEINGTEVYTETPKPKLQRYHWQSYNERFRKMPHQAQGMWIAMLNHEMAYQRYMDAQLGRITKLLKDNPEVAKNTIVIFTGDHGSNMGSHGLRAKGGAGYEESLNIPLYVRIPDGYGNYYQGDRDQLTSNVDVLPFIISLAEPNWSPTNPNKTTWQNSTMQNPNYLRNPNRCDLRAAIESPTTTPGRDHILTTIYEQYEITASLKKESKSSTDTNGNPLTLYSYNLPPAYVTGTNSARTANNDCANERNTRFYPEYTFPSYITVYAKKDPNANRIGKKLVVYNKWKFDHFIENMTDNNANPPVNPTLQPAWKDNEWLAGNQGKQIVFNQEEYELFDHTAPNGVLELDNLAANITNARTTSNTLLAQMYSELYGSTLNVAGGIYKTELVNDGNLPASIKAASNYMWRYYVDGTLYQNEAASGTYSPAPAPACANDPAEPSSQPPDPLVEINFDVDN